MLSISRIFFPPRAYKYIELPNEILIELAFVDPEVFSLLYCTCKHINSQLRKGLSRALLNFRVAIPDQPQLWIYPDRYKYGLEIHDNILAYTVNRYITDDIIYSVYRDKHELSICFRRDNELWKWYDTDGNKLILYKRGKLGDNNWYGLQHIDDIYLEIIGFHDSYSISPTYNEVSNYEAELELALSLLSHQEV